jgi:hypothetical protein
LRQVENTRKELGRDITAKQPISKTCLAALAGKRPHDMAMTPMRAES